MKSSVTTAGSSGRTLDQNKHTRKQLKKVPPDKNALLPYSELCLRNPLCISSENSRYIHTHARTCCHNRTNQHTHTRTHTHTHTPTYTHTHTRRQECRANHQIAVTIRALRISSRGGSHTRARPQVGAPKALQCHCFGVSISAMRSCIPKIVSAPLLHKRREPRCVHDIVVYSLSHFKHAYIIMHCPLFT